MFSGFEFCHSFKNWIEEKRTNGKKRKERPGEGGAPVSRDPLVEVNSNLPWRETGTAKSR